MTDFTLSWGTRPAHRPTAPRPLNRPRAARLSPLPRLTANRLTAPLCNRVADDGLYLFVGDKARASPNRTTPLARPRAARLHIRRHRGILCLRSIADMGANLVSTGIVEAG